MAQTLRLLKRDYAAALENALRAEVLLSEAANSGQTTPELREQTQRNWGLASLEVGRAAFALGRREEGQKAFEAAIDRFQDLLQASPKNTTHQLSLQVASAEYGDLLLIQLRQPSAARRRYEVAVIQSRALALPVEVAKYQQKTLALDHYRLGTAALKDGDKAAAARSFAVTLAWREAYLRELESSPEAVKDPGILTEPRINVMLAQARCGKHREAAEMAARLLKAGSSLPATHPRKHSLLLAAAFGHALAADAAEPAKRKEYFGKALEALRFAVESGFRDLNKLETDPDLDPLRDDPEFRKEYQALVQRVRDGK
jgi:tetratricopeptide (TPR) repeat protein